MAGFTAEKKSYFTAMDNPRYKFEAILVSLISKQRSIRQRTPVNWINIVFALVVCTCPAPPTGKPIVCF